MSDGDYQCGSAEEKAPALGKVAPILQVHHIKAYVMRMMEIWV